MSHSPIHWTTSNVRNGMPKEISGEIYHLHFEDIVANMLDRQRLLGYNMGLRLRYLHSHLGYFQENWGFPVKKSKLSPRVWKRRKRMPGTLWCNKMADDCSPSNQQPPQAHSLNSRHPQDNRKHKARINAPPHRF